MEATDKFLSVAGSSRSGLLGSNFFEWREDFSLVTCLSADGPLATLGKFSCGQERSRSEGAGVFASSHQVFT
jgi:hypothetical protein